MISNQLFLHQHHYHGNAYTTLKPVKVVDPRVNIQEAKKYLFKQGAKVVTHRTYTSTSSSTSSTSFKCNPPNPDIIISRLVFLTMRVTFNINGRYLNRNNGNAVTNTNLSALVSGGQGLNAICPRQFPLASAMNNLKVNINSDSLSVTPKDYIHALGRFNLDDNIRAYEMSSSPSQPDAFQKYADGSNLSSYPAGGGAAIAGSQGLNYGTNRSPFANYGDVGYEIPRGSYKPISIAYDNGTGVTQVVYEFTEPIFISPLSGGSSNLMGLSQVSTMDIDISWDSSKLSRMLSIDQSLINTIAQDAIPVGGNNVENSRYIDSIGVDISQTALQKVSFIYFTPQIGRPRPESLVYDYHDLYVYRKNLGALAAGAPEQKFQSDNMSLSNIPSKVYIFAKLREADESFYTSDNFARITKIDINFNGVSGVLSSANEWIEKCVP